MVINENLVLVIKGLIAKYFQGKRLNMKESSMYIDLQLDYKSFGICTFGNSRVESLYFNDCASVTTFAFFLTL